MEFKELFGKENSRATVDFVKDLVKQQPELFEEIFKIVMLDEEPYSRRAFWAFDIIDEEFPGVAKPYLPRLIDKIDSYDHDAFIRHTLRILTRNEIPEECMVKVLDYCFSVLKGHYPAAIVVHAMQILYNISEQEPQLKPELISAIELVVVEGSTGVKNRGHRMLKKLYKEIG